MFIALFSTVTKRVLLHKLISLSIFQTTIIWLYLTIGFNYRARPPVINAGNLSLNTEIIYNNPLPHALMLTAIVVGLATFAIGLAIIIKISRLEVLSRHELEK
jgi:multicomponent Na+:H+ antiporter subunit C